MDARNLLVRGYAMGARVYPTMGGMVIGCCTALLLGYASLVQAQIPLRLELLASQETVPLTAAQKEAKQLATALAGTPTPQADTSKAGPLTVILEQPLSPGQRPMVPVFFVGSMEGRFVGGQQTLASPVAPEPSHTVEDANRPMFIPASQAAVAVELLIE